MNINPLEKTNISTVFNASRKLTADSMVLYTKDGQSKYRKIAHLISEDPEYLWRKIYQPCAPFGLARCAYGRLKEAIQREHPDLILQIELRKQRYRRQR
jgi:hypothetical protein